MPPDLPAGYSARRAIWRLTLVAWSLVVMFVGLFHVPNAIDERGAIFFYGGQVISCALVAWLDRRDTDAAKWAATLFAVGSVMAFAGFAGPLAGLVLFAIGLAYLALVWQLPEHRLNAPLRGTTPVVALRVGSCS